MLNFPFFESAANSNRVIAEIAKPSSFLRASSMAVFAFWESRASSNASHTTMWVSTRINRDRPTLQV